jgi:hypothetical protein
MVIIVTMGVLIGSINSNGLLPTNCTYVNNSTASVVLASIPPPNVFMGSTMLTVDSTTSGVWIPETPGPYNCALNMCLLFKSYYTNGDVLVNCPKNPNSQLIYESVPVVNQTYVIVIAVFGSLLGVLVVVMGIAAIIMVVKE